MCAAKITSPFGPVRVIYRLKGRVGIESALPRSAEIISRRFNCLLWRLAMHTIARMLKWASYKGEKSSCNAASIAAKHHIDKI
jgi:hypothetical protein